MMLLFETLLYFLIFSVISWFIYYVVGFGLLAKQQKVLTGPETITLSFCIGILLFVLTAVFSSLLNIRWIVLPLFVLLGVLVVFKNKTSIFSPWKTFFSDKILLGLIFLGIIVQGFINFPSGYSYGGELHFWSSQGHDGLWHVASMEEIKKAIPPQNPGFAGEVLYNYHYLVDILMGEFLRIFPFFSSLDLYFRFFPVIFSILIGLSAYSFVTRWQNNSQIGYWGVFFTYFVGSFGFIFTLFHSGRLFAGETVFWAAQQNTILGNPPHAISHILFPAFLLSFLIYLQERSKVWFGVTFLMGCILAGFKVSGGLVMLTGMSVAVLVDFIRNRKFSILVLAFLVGVSNILTFKSMTGKDAASFLMFLPWWFVRTMVVDRLGWIDLELRRQHYIDKGTWQSFLRVIQVEAMAFGIFVIGNLGMRIVGLIEIGRMLFKQKKLVIEPITVFLLVSMFTAFIIPIFFVQKGLIYNNIQFMQYFLLLFGFFGAVSTYRLLSAVKNKSFKIVIVAVLVSLSVPTVIGNLVEFYGPKTNPLSKISQAELQAIQYLKENSQEDEVILTAPFDQYIRGRFKFQPLPMYAWYDTSYISALSGRPSYLASEHVTLLFYPGTDIRQENKKRFFEQTDVEWTKTFLKEAGISYIYLAKEEITAPIDALQNSLIVFFENEEVIIYQVK